MSVKRRAALAFCGATLSFLVACGGDLSGIGLPPAPSPAVAKLLSIAVTPPTASFDTAGTQQFLATGTFSDGTTADLSSSVTWKVSSTPTAAITAAGLASGVDVGTSTITASAGELVSNPAALEVTPTAWKVSSLMNSSRAGSKAVVLASGKVLVTGGSADANSAELYDPLTNKWELTSPMNLNRNIHSMVLLKTGEVLVFGGNNGGDRYQFKSEIYNPATGNWRVVGDMNKGRSFYAATMLNDGRVLVSGGTVATATAPGRVSVADVEIYDPLTEKWSVVKSQNVARTFHTATLLETSGKVLVVGGVGEGGSRSVTAELYDPATNAWTMTTGSMSVSRQQHTATLLQNGKVMAIGGRTGGGNGWTAKTEIFDPATGLWTAGESLTFQRSVHTATLMPNGDVVVAAGEYTAVAGPPISIASSETFRKSGGMPVLKTMNEARVFHSTVLLPNGRLVTVGGGANDSEVAKRSAELL